MSEGHASSLRILRTVQPTRHLFDGKRYVPAANTDIARTFRKARLLARIQGAKA